ncbi:hypothetical protein quinque_008799 [Culex quinquefasciatus]|uniref:Uncharacterized protein n=1 Tax=Culex pipiens pipiens TaxID=38569 RepID=A0ABD1DTF2_CULPP
MEIGYTFTASLEDCKNHLLKVGGREISAQDVVKPEIFVQALKERVPSFNWNDGCLALDHQEFLIKDRPGLSLLLSIVKMGLSLITMILKNRSDLYSFADYIYTSVSVDLLKITPEKDNEEVASWTFLHQVDNSARTFC